MAKLVKISIVIPTYDSIEYIAESIESVLAQTYKYTEIIVVDDGSTDGTKGALEKYRDYIRYFYCDNGGVSKARNFGIEKAVGKYVAFLDADDVWESTKLEKQVELLESREGAKACYSAFSLVDVNLNSVGINRSERVSNTLKDLLITGNVVGTPKYRNS